MAGLFSKALRGWSNAAVDIGMHELKSRADQARQENLARFKVGLEKESLKGRYTQETDKEGNLIQTDTLSGSQDG